MGSPGKPHWAGWLCGGGIGRKLEMEGGHILTLKPFRYREGLCQKD